MHERNHFNNYSLDENNIRHPRLDDIPALLHLEKECWPEPLRASPETILHRIEHFPAGHLVYELNGRVVGVIYSQRIQSTEPLKTTNSRNVSSLHTANGPITQLLALNVLPELKHLMLGDQLLTCMLRRCLLEKGTKKVVAVTLCQNYGKQTHLSINEYIHARNAHGQLLDPILRFHECHGATIKDMIPGYRPEDADNQGNGVLVEYGLGNENAATHQQGKPNEAGHDDDLASAIKKYVVSVTRNDDEQGYSPKRALMDMGLGSLDLYGLRMLIGRKLGVDLDPSFFFRYGTPESIVAYFDSKDKGRMGGNERQKPTDFSHQTTSLPTDNRAPNTASYKEDSIAIIGMSCRLPGSVNSVDAFWRLLRDGKDAIIEIPKSRWDAGLYYSSDKDAPGKIVTRFGGFLDEVDRFDASFFNIAPREAVNTDPQQRILLELTWEALEHAGLNPESLAGTQTGVFAGIFSNDYELLHVKCHDPQSLNAYFATGNSTSLAAGRISYVFGFQGPAIAVNTACSSSLVAVHLACQSLRNGECGLAIASGINLLLSPEMSIAFSRSGMLAPDGRCKTFDAGANGYVRSEGGGVVVLKRLSQAIADNNTILAVVRGTAINHDGASNGLTAPNGLAQEAVIRKALSDANVAPDVISYIEAHGTGTSLGDPVELQALEAVYAQGRNKDNPLILGSVKTNIGHTEAAAGIAGLIKVVLSMQHGYIPPHLHFKKLNPLISLEKMNGMIPTEGMEWARPGGNGKYMAGVSSFGFSGTNAHVIVEEAPVVSRNKLTDGDKERPLHLLTLSAKDAPALQTLAERYDAYLEANKDADLADICYTANTGRSHFAHRLAFIGESPSKIREGLKTFLAGQQGNEVISGAVREEKGQKAAFLFTGQGAQYRYMGKHLFETQPVFRDLLCRCGEILNMYLKKPLLEVLYPGNDEATLLNETEYTQPAMFSLEYALAGLWKSWGITPGAVIGHSVGEYAAACVAGVFSLEDGLKLIAGRARLMQALPRTGGMWAVFADEEKVVKAIAPYAKEVSIAAYNGPNLLVISGLRNTLKVVIDSLERNGIKSVPLQVSHAFHSPLMEPMLSDFEIVAGEVSYSPPQIPIISNLSGSQAGDEIATPGYWMSHIRAPVRFASGMATLFQQGYEIFLEIGPKPVLSGMARKIEDNGRFLWLPSLNEDKPDWLQLLQSLGRLYVNGVAVDWDGFDRHSPRCRVALPTYPFQRKRYWINTEFLSKGGDGLSRQQNTERLLRQQEESGKFTTEEMQLMPRILDALLNQGNEESATGMGNKHLFQIHWKPAHLQKTEPPSKYMPSPEIIKAALESSGSNTQRGRPELLSKLESLSISYVLYALREMGWEFREDQSFSTEEAVSKTAIADKHKRLLNHLFGMLAEEGILEQNGNGWRVRRVPGVYDPRPYQEALLNDYPELKAELTILGRCGSNLAKVMRGECDPTQLIFPNADVAMAATLYQDSPSFGIMNGLITQAISLIGDHVPSGQKIRVLEIGAGTGGTTSHVLPVLAGHTAEYVFTDVSALFTAKAKEKFKAYPFMQYRLLDVEQSSESQSFQPQQYDIILASNVLHATRDMQHTLRHVRQLLSPGGMLLLIEGIGRRRWIDLIFGLLEGWWRFSDHQLRPSHPLLSISQWETILKETGFHQAAAVVPNHEDGSGLFPQAVIIAQYPRQNPADAEKKRNWLVFSETRGTGRKLAALLQERGALCTLVFPGKSYQPLSNHEFTIDPCNKGDFVKLLGETGVNDRLDGIAHLWSLEQSTSENNTSLTLEKASELGCRSVLNLVQALDALQSNVASLWLITQGAQDTITHQSGVAQSPLWGFGKVLIREYPRLQCRLADVDPGDDEYILPALCEEMCSHKTGDIEHFLSFHGRQRHVARFSRAMQSNENQQPLQLRTDGAYLITGGLGGVGLKVARWLVERGAKHLALVGRSNPSASAEKAIMELERSGCVVAVLQADVSHFEQIAGVFQRVAESMPPLRGIIHCAGVFEDRLLANQEWPLFEKVFAPKVKGSWNLHVLSEKLPLDFFVLFSSAFSLFGETGLGNYAAGNAFLDALARYRRGQGLPGLSVNWGPWEKVGMAQAVGERREAQWLAQGIETLQPAQALEMLEYLMQGDSPQTCAMPLNLQTFTHHFPEGFQRTFFENIVEGQSQQVQEKPGILQRLNAAPANERLGILQGHVSALVAGTLGYHSSEPLDVHRGFFQLGMDSLTSMELRNRLESSLNRSFPSTVLFKYPSIHALTGYLMQEMSSSAPAAQNKEFTHKPNTTYMSEVVAPGASLSSVQASAEEMPVPQPEPSLLEELEGLEKLLKNE